MSLNLTKPISIQKGFPILETSPCLFASAKTVVGFSKPSAHILVIPYIVTIRKP